MSGIYVHVPYCKHKCDYCDFYSVVSMHRKDDFAGLITKELRLRRDYLPQGDVNTIYFGGGTPSLLTPQDIATILNEIDKHFKVSLNAEITLEANPDDVDGIYLNGLLDAGVNRLSIGVQSFNDNDLKLLERRHNARQAISSVETAFTSGFSSLSLDLMYGLPYSTNEIWKDNLRKAFQLPIEHMSCYHLVVEEGTPLLTKVQKGLVKPVSEEVSVAQFEILREMARLNNFLYYEVSSLAKDGRFSRHNTAYWKGIPYLGLGPGAHSYNGTTRDGNPHSVARWANSIEKGEVASLSEVLSRNDMLNDYLIISLRTMWGLDLDRVEQQFGSDVAKEILKTASKYCERNMMIRDGDTLRIKEDHFLTSDAIISDFLVV